MNDLHSNKHETGNESLDQTKRVSQNGISRRGFFKLAGIAAAAGAAGVSFPKGAGAAPSRLLSLDARLPKDLFWKGVQKQFIMDPKVVYMNIGTTGSMPQQILKNYQKYNELAAFHPRTFEAELGADFGLPAQRAELAAQFGCNADEICLSRNTTDGMDSILFGLNFREGDEILATHHEHIAALSPLNVLRDRYGIAVKELEIPVLDTASEDQFVDLFARNITNNTKAILFSHITYKTGTRLPAKALCTLARENGLISIVDGAHGPGMLKLDFHDMGCDFYAGPGHKWQCGPGGTGILYLRHHGENLPEFWTQNASTYTFIAQPVKNDRSKYDMGMAMQYRGQMDVSAHLAMMDACKMWEEIGRDKIEEYVCSLSSYLKKSLGQKYGGAGTFFAPDIPEFSTGLTSFNPFANIQDGNKIKTLVARLENETGYQVRYTDFHLHAGDTEPTYALRISTHIFHNRAQVDGLVDALYDLSLEIEG